MSEAVDNRRKFARYPAGNAKASITCGGDTFTATVFDESIGGLCLIVDGRPSPKLFVGDEVGVNHRDEQGTAYVRSSQQIEGEQVRLGLSWDPPSPDEIPDEVKRKEGNSGGKKDLKHDVIVPTDNVRIAPASPASVDESLSVPEPTHDEPDFLAPDFDDLYSEPALDSESDLDLEPSQSSKSKSHCDTESFDILEQVFYTHGDVSIVCNVVGIGPNGEVRVQINDEKTFLADGRKLVTRNRAKRHIEIDNDEMLQTLAGFYQIEPTVDAILAHEFR